MPADMPDKPEWLSAEAKKQWNYIAPKLLAQGILTELDGISLGMLCEVLAEFSQVNKAVRKLPVKKRYLDTTKKGNTIQNPLVSIRNQLWHNVLKAAAEFGLTPSSRAGLVKPGKDPKDKPASRFFDVAS